MQDMATALQRKMDVLIEEIEDMCGLAQSDKKHTTNEKVIFSNKVISTREVASVPIETALISMLDCKSKEWQNIGIALASFSRLEIL
jgi:hypothetical protein